MRPLISHEIPSALFPYHDLINDYPYVLAHLLGVNSDYSEFYKKKLQEAKYSILDNSAFELGKPIDGQLLIDLAIEYEPTHVVIPDSLHDHKQTIELAQQFFELRREYSMGELDWLKNIGVCQGSNIEEATECFRFFLEKDIDIIAIPFDLFPDSDHVTDRFRFIQELSRQPYMNTSRPNVKIHLLGCKNPVEFQLFKNQNFSKFIYSIDTSSPIVNGFVGNRLNENGLTQPKPKEKLADNIDRKLSSDDISTIVSNIIQFRKYVEWE